MFPKPGFIFQEIYNATEGFFAVQDRDELRTMLLLLTTGIYYEFIPWADYQRQDYGAAVSLAGVQTEVSYVMLITTVAGLYRYPMGDLIAFTETDPYRIVIQGRTQEFINAFGEDLLRSEAEQALVEACGVAGATVRDFTVAPDYIEVGKAGRHHWLIEFERAPADLEQFNAALDRALQEKNYNYAAKRGKRLRHRAPWSDGGASGVFSELVSESRQAGGTAQGAAAGESPGVLGGYAGAVVEAAKRTAEVAEGRRGLTELNSADLRVLCGCLLPSRC